VALALPDPEQEWRAGDVPDRVSKTLRALCEKGAIVRIRQEQYSDCQSKLGVYRTVERVDRWITEHIPVLPGCQHGGVRCVESGTTYTCSEPDCDERFNRETARERMRLADTRAEVSR
jgi:hypothetical protein